MSSPVVLFVGRWPDAKRFEQLDSRRAADFRIEVFEHSSRIVSPDPRVQSPGIHRAVVEMASVEFREFGDQYLWDHIFYRDEAEFAVCFRSIDEYLRVVNIDLAVYLLDICLMDIHCRARRQSNASADRNVAVEQGLIDVVILRGRRTNLRELLAALLPACFVTVMCLDLAVDCGPDRDGDRRGCHE